MVYMQILLGVGLGLVVSGFMYFMSNQRTNSSHHSYSRTSTHGSSWSDSERNDTKRKHPISSPGDTCIICLKKMDEHDMQYFSCKHALHSACAEICRKARDTCPHCNTAIDEKDETCVVCLDEMKPGSFKYMKCEHTLHTDCYYTYMQKGFKTCPVCRTPI